MLLVLNLIAVAGFVLFLAKCRPISVRSGDAFHEIRPRAEAANLSAHSASPIQDAVLKRLSLLEDIVYRQLNGKDARGCPWGSARAGRAPGASRGALSAVWKAGTSGSRALPFPLLAHSQAGGRGCWKELPASFFYTLAVSLLLSWKEVSAGSSRAGIITWRLWSKCRN